MAPQYPSIANGQVWISPQVLEWEVRGSGGTDYDESSARQRSYQSWAHADHLIQIHDDEHYLSDAMVTLHRVVDQRVRRLNELYRFRKIPIRDKPAELWELLNYLGIIRPRMFAQLKEVRRGIEHFAKAPPPQERCAELSEFVWYFLQCTDRLTKQVSYDFETADRYGRYGIFFNGGPEQEWCFHIESGSVPLEFISAFQKHGWLEVKNARAIGPDDYVGNGGVVIREGTITGPAELMKRLVEVYFSLPF